MTKIRNTIIILLTLAILCSLFVVVFAVGNPNAEDEILPPAVNAYEYAKAPEGIYVFHYFGSAPSADLDIDTSECVVDRLYVYHSETDSVVEIIAQEVSDYTCTQTALYYVTEEQKVYKTDYTGTNHEYLYQCTQGTISMLSSYYDALYFIEAQTRIIYLDTTNKVAQEIWTYEYLDWVFMLNDTQLIATTPEEEDYLFDISTDTATQVSSILATNMVTAAIKGTSSSNARSSNNPTASYANVVPTQENNVTFPLTEYWADPDGCYDTTSPRYGRPTSWFHKNGLEGCNGGTNCEEYGGSSECEGFARYVHDYYAHMLGDNFPNRNAWKNDKCIIEYEPLYTSSDDDSDSYKLWPNDDTTDITRIKAFFTSLKTGAYVRYGKYENKDGDPEDGCHSIVFIDSDADGIWVYECNQDYDTNSNHGCGVFIQYHPYVRLSRYKFILHYVNHEYKATASEPLAYYNAYYHKKGCKSCAAYVCQAHTNISATIASTTQHNATFNCCGGNTATTWHTGTVSYSSHSTTLHKVRYSCCTGYVLANHTFVTGPYGGLMCADCGQGQNAIMAVGEPTAVNI